MDEYAHHLPEAARHGSTRQFAAGTLQPTPTVDIGRYHFDGPYEDPARLGRGRAGVLAVLDDEGVVAVEPHENLIAGAEAHPGRRYAAYYTDLYPQPTAQADRARHNLARIIRSRVPVPERPSGFGVEDQVPRVGYPDLDPEPGADQPWPMTP